MSTTAQRISSELTTEFARELVREWLSSDVHAQDGRIRRSLGGTAIPADDTLGNLGHRILGALTSGEFGDLNGWLVQGGASGYPDDLVVFMAQLLVSRSADALRARLGADPICPDVLGLFRDRGDALIRALFDFQHRRLRAALPGEDEEFLELAQVVTDTLYSTLSSGMVRYVSPGIEELTGRAPQEFLTNQHLWASLVVEADLPAMRDIFHTVLVRGEAAESVYRIRRSDGSLRHVLDRATPVVVEGEVVRIDGILVDITERVELELRLERSETLRSLGQLARDVAHDFNNLLVSILGHADLMLARTEPDSRDSRSLRLIGAAAEKGSQLTDRLLTFARGSAASSNKVETALGPMVKEAVELAGPSISQRLDLEASAAPDTPLVLADGGRLGESVLNLVINAGHACGSEHGTIIRADVRRATDDEARRIGALEASVIEVSDDGPGMSSQVRSRVFEPLFTTRAKTGGTGLGCAIAYGVAVDHGGVLEVDSEPGEGATFRFILPAAGLGSSGAAPTRPGSTRRPKPRTSPGSKPAVQQKSGHTTPVSSASTARRVVEATVSVTAAASAGAHILVVDDEPSVRHLLRDLLEGAGYRVDTASGGQEAIDCVLAQPGEFALVILDVMMHPVDGTEAFARLREASPDLPMIFCTGHSDATRIAVPAALSSAPIVRKPFRAAHLIQAVRDNMRAA